jgi:two-component system alkaline phosphatase synthesis response regulator PhoP
MVKILIVDDEPNLTDLIESYLRREGYTALIARDGPSALAVAQRERPELIVLDIMLPGLDGVEVCRRLRQFTDAYIIMLTARGEEIDKIIGLSVGADDYMTKPFSPRELVARVKAMLRRPRAEVSAAAREEPTLLRLGDLEIDQARHHVTLRGEEIALTAREFSLLAALAAHPGRVFTREQLLEGVWGDDYYDDHVVDVHIANLRRKLDEEPAAPRYIQTVRGVGYRLSARLE